jgi:hypothetical protein
MYTALWMLTVESECDRHRQWLSLFQQCVGAFWVIVLLQLLHLVSEIACRQCVA